MEIIREIQHGKDKEWATDHHCRDTTVYYCAKFCTTLFTRILRRIIALWVTVGIFLAAPYSLSTHALRPNDNHTKNYARVNSCTMM